MARAGGFAALGALAAAAVLAAAPAASAETVALGPNSPSLPFHSWTVPAKVCSATFDLFGAEGSGGIGGARVTTTLTVEPGTRYYIFVGSWGTVGNGGYNGGGDASGDGVGGGGATDVRTGPGLADRILVAGGGGGNGGSYAGTAGGAGGGGGLMGGDGATAAGMYAGQGGDGGTAFSGGAFGAGLGGNGAPGTLGSGGEGGIFQPGVSSTGYGGGGGGGLYGGGGGGASAPGGGGGGGSSLAGGGTVNITAGGQGKAIITYAASPACGQAGGGGGGGGGGGQTGGGGDRTKPTLSRLTFSRYSFTAATSGSSVSANTKATPKTGTKISFSLSESSSVRFTVERKARGRKLRGRCVKPGQSTGGKRCTRWEGVKGSFSFAGTAGRNSFIFRGRIGGKSVKPGDYRLNSKATDNAHNASPLKRKGFTIVP
jgi:hypothetical protein